MDDVNQFLVHKNVRILYDDAHNTWICLQYCPKGKKRQQIKMFSPVMEVEEGWLKFPMARAKLVKEVNAWLPNLEDPFKCLEMPPCSKSKQSAIQFVYVLAFAFGCTLDFNESIHNPCGDKTVENIRQIIGNALSNGLENEMPTIQAIWGASSVN